MSLMVLGIRVYWSKIEWHPGPRRLVRVKNRKTKILNFFSKTKKNDKITFHRKILYMLNLFRARRLLTREEVAPRRCASKCWLPFSEGSSNDYIFYIFIALFQIIFDQLCWSLAKIHQKMALKVTEVFPSYFNWLHECFSFLKFWNS